MIAKVRSLLGLPWVYQMFFNMVGGPRRSRILVREYIQPRPGSRILEIGCGPGTIVPFLPPSEYVGFDMSPGYIELARRRYPEQTFICERVSQYTLPQQSYFDFVLALGIVHHLEDSEALQLFRIAHDALRPGGKLVTLDGVFIKEQSAAAKYLLARDRGRFVRSREAYEQIASQAFARVKVNIRHDMLRIPYTEIVLECTR